MADHQLQDVPEHEGLTECKVCGAAEGELPTECPGRPMTLSEKEEVFTHILDFVNGEWVRFP